MFCLRRLQVGDSVDPVSCGKQFVSLLNQRQTEIWISSDHWSPNLLWTAQVNPVLTVTIKAAGASESRGKYWNLQQGELSHQYAKGNIFFTQWFIFDYRSIFFWNFWLCKSSNLGKILIILNNNLVLRYLECSPENKIFFYCQQI